MKETECKSGGVKKDVGKGSGDRYPGPHPI